MLPRHPNDIDAAWLTSCLRAGGSLPTGQVTDLRVALGAKWNIAQTARLHLGYDTDAPRDAPPSLFVKIRTTLDPYEEHYKGEHAFYTQAGRHQALPIPKCYGAYRDADSVTCILLEDLSDTHDQPHWPQLATSRQYDCAVAALAHLHVHGWGAGDAGLVPHQNNLLRRVDFFQRHVQELLPAFLTAAGERLSPGQQNIMRRVCGAFPNLLRNRLLDGQPLTRVHGDPHTGNILFPRDTTRHGCVIIDWEDWHINPGPFDMAYMMAFHWDRDRRARDEIRLLRLYHRALMDRVSGGYGWQQLQDDYRLGHLHNFVVPLFQMNMGHGPDVWAKGLEPLFQAFEDLNCADLMS